MEHLHFWQNSRQANGPGTTCWELLPWMSTFAKQLVSSTQIRVKYILLPSELKKKTNKYDTYSIFYLIFILIYGCTLCPGIDLYELSFFFSFSFYMLDSNILSWFPLLSKLSWRVCSFWPQTSLLCSKWILSMCITIKGPSQQLPLITFQPIILLS